MKEFKIGSLKFRNPVITASGTFGMGDVFSDFIDYSKIGGITLKTVTRNPRKGNPPPRILETPSGLLNSIGLENEGFEKVYSGLNQDDYLKCCDTNIIFSIAGESKEDYIDMAEAFSQIKSIAMLELNLSCPNIHAGGATFDSDPDVVIYIIKNLRKKITKPFAVKLSPANDLVKNSMIASDYGADAVTISNTFLGMAIDIQKKDFVFKNKVAGYSGPAVKPIALYNVFKAAQAVKIPMISSGGIASINDAREFLIAGAQFISIGTMNFLEPDISMKIAEDLENWDYLQ